MVNSLALYNHVCGEYKAIGGSWLIDSKMVVLRIAIRAIRLIGNGVERVECDHMIALIM